jgi:hypothetical protein
VDLAKSAVWVLYHVIWRDGESDDIIQHDYLTISHERRGDYKPIFTELQAAK